MLSPHCPGGHSGHWRRHAPEGLHCQNLLQSEQLLILNSSDRNRQELTVLMDVVVEAGLVSQVELAVWHQATVILTLSRKDLF